MEKQKLYIKLDIIYLLGKTGSFAYLYSAATEGRDLVENHKL